MNIIRKVLARFVQPHTPDAPDVQKEIEDRFEKLLAERRSYTPKTEQDRENHKLIRQLAYINKIPMQVVRDDIRKLDENELHKKYGITDQRVVSDLKGFVARTPELDDAS